MTDGGLTNTSIVSRWPTPINFTLWWLSVHDVNKKILVSTIEVDDNSKLQLSVQEQKVKGSLHLKHKLIKVFCTDKTMAYDFISHIWDIFNILITRLWNEIPTTRSLFFQKKNLQRNLWKNEWTRWVNLPSIW